MALEASERRTVAQIRKSKSPSSSEQNAKRIKSKLEETRVTHSNETSNAGIDGKLYTTTKKETSIRLLIIHYATYTPHAHRKKTHQKNEVHKKPASFTSWQCLSRISGLDIECVHTYNETRKTIAGT